MPLRRRKQLFEFEDQPWFPDAIRTCMTDFLSFVGNLTPLPYEGFVESLAEAMRHMGTNQLLDLASGGSGPIVTVSKMLRDRHGLDVDARLTDLYPNLEKFRYTREQSDGRVDFVSEPVDATKVAPELDGFRVLFNAFHHFPPELGLAVLADAVRQRRGIALFEGVARTPAGIAGVGIVPWAVLGATPFIRPFRWQRLALTYVVPAVPLFTFWDGFASSFRIYSPEELQELVNSLDAPDYHWDIRRTYYRPSPVPVTTLVGYPKNP